MKVANKILRFKLERVQMNQGCMWEKGGSNGKSGFCQLISNSLGERKQPVYIVTRGKRENHNHALIEMNDGDLILRMERMEEKYTYTFYKVLKVMCSEERIRVEEVYRNESSINDVYLLEWFTSSFHAMVEVAKRKVNEKGCIEPMYIVDNMKG